MSKIVKFNLVLAGIILITFTHVVQLLREWHLQQLFCLSIYNQILCFLL